jgi:hypothetical protein
MRRTLLISGAVAVGLMLANAPDAEATPDEQFVVDADKAQFIVTPDLGRAICMDLDDGYSMAFTVRDTWQGTDIPRIERVRELISIAVTDLCPWNGPRTIT